MPVTRHAFTTVSVSLGIYKEIVSKLLVLQISGHHKFMLRLRIMLK
ncbi:hypothetical protein CHRY9393_00055 [Chryseobacterium fistulae]|uniref:Uncharacterized protein n=1 Tax=Chryseobacterium fistulae TaxID=2675058 RepID=A0A6N4XQU6_9FLAO|nr:hypothetical protein CHRY9393_00055 [Chryseobacterium fistulae]